MQPDTLGPLDDIRVAAQFIADDTAGKTLEEFVQDRRTRQAVERNFEIIGEAVNRLRKRDPAVAARLTVHHRIVALRNVLIHGYDTIDYQSLWLTIHESLPVLRVEVASILGEHGNFSFSIEGSHK